MKDNSPYDPISETLKVALIWAGATAVVVGPVYLAALVVEYGLANQ